MIGRALFFGLVILPGAAFAQTETFALPAECNAFVTVQSTSCEVTHHFICDGEPVGIKQRVALDEQGMTYLGSTNSEAEWVSSFHPFTGHSERLADNPTDPASLSELLQTGTDTYDFITESAEIGETRYVGFDELTGETVTIDGVTLQRTRYQITAFNVAGDEMWSSAGNEFVNSEWRMFLGGTGVIEMPGDSFEKDDTPMEFIFPGESGFLSENPKYGCGAVMSSVPNTARLKEFDHDQL